MKRMICAACALMMAFIPAPVQAEGGEKAAVIILDAAGCPAEAAEEPWLMQPCHERGALLFPPYGKRRAGYARKLCAQLALHGGQGGDALEAVA